MALDTPQAVIASFGITDLETTAEWQLDGACAELADYLAHADMTDAERLAARIAHGQLSRAYLHANATDPDDYDF